MSEALKPCPFCGSKHLRVKVGDFCCWVECDDCEAEGPFLILRGSKRIREKGIKAWNTRAEVKGDE